jgi:hypothetical protein
MEAPMDGPRLQGTPPSPLAGFERRQYDDVAAANLVLVLTTDLNTLRGRKLDLEVEEHRAKVEAVQRLAPGPGRVIIDAGDGYERVLLDAKRAVWTAIRERC